MRKGECAGAAAVLEAHPVGRARAIRLVKKLVGAEEDGSGSSHHRMGFVDVGSRLLDQILTAFENGTVVFEGRHT